MKTFIIRPFARLRWVLAFMASGCFLSAAQPNWWAEYSLIDGSTRQDRAVATLGQAKHAVQKAHQYFNDELEAVGGARSKVTALYNAYCITEPADPDNDLNPLTLGQLKYLAKPFYDRLSNPEVGLNTSGMNPASTDIYPWTVVQTDDADLALATIGQLKFVFSFDLSGWSFIDTDADGIQDRWEEFYDILAQDATDDADGDRFTNYVEYLIGSVANSKDTQDSDAVLSAKVDSSDADLILVVGNQIMEVKNTETTAHLSHSNFR